MYKLLKNDDGTLANIIIRIYDNASIPKHESNRDYQEYLEWLSEGNTPKPADKK